MIRTRNLNKHVGHRPIQDMTDSKVNLNSAKLMMNIWNCFMFIAIASFETFIMVYDYAHYLGENKISNFFSLYKSIRSISCNR